MIVRIRMRLKVLWLKWPARRPAEATIRANSLTWLKLSPVKKLVRFL